MNSSFENRPLIHPCDAFEVPPGHYRLPNSMTAVDIDIVDGHRRFHFEAHKEVPRYEFQL